MSDLAPGASLHEPEHPLDTPPTAEALAAAVRDAAIALGFVRVGFAPVERFAAAEARVSRWLDARFHGDMAYLESPSRGDAARLLASAKTIIAVALPYAGAADPPPLDGEPRRLTGFVARYARGADYHSVIKLKLRELADECAKLVGRAVLARPCVDTAPLLEREAAERAGLGFAAKNTMTIVPGVGSYVLLGELLVDVEIAPGRRLEPRCGSCTACLDACPSGAFVDAHVLDARRCISYLTIELRGPIPRDLRPLVGRRVFGCDVCQEVCPFNAGAGRASAPELAAPGIEAGEPDLVSLLELSSSGYRRLVRQSALGRVSRTRLARNAAVALGNSGDPRAVEPLARAVASHPSALVRAHAAWALGQIGGDRAYTALERASSDENAEVRDEADHALRALGQRPA